MEDAVQVAVGALTYLGLSSLSNRVFPRSHGQNHLNDADSQRLDVDNAIRDINQALFQRDPSFFGGQAPTDQQVIPLDELASLTDLNRITNTNLRSAALQMLLDRADNDNVIKTCLERLEIPEEQEKASVVLGLLVSKDEIVRKFIKIHKGHEVVAKLLRTSFPRVTDPTASPPTSMSPVTETMCMAILYSCANVQLKPVLRTHVIPLCRDILVQAVEDDKQRPKPPRVPIDLGYWALMMISQIVSVWDPNLIRRMIQAGFPKLTVQLSRLTFGNPQTVPSTALRTLAQMVEQLRDSPAQQRVVQGLIQDESLGYLGMLVQGLRSDDARMVYWCLLLVGTFAQHVNTFNITKVNVSLVNNLIRLVAYVDTDDFAGNSDRVLMDIIKKLCKNDFYAKQFMKSGLISRLCTYGVKSPRSSVRLHALGILSQLFDQYPDSHALFYATDTHKYLVDLARENLGRVGHVRHMGEYVFAYVGDILMTLSSHAKDSDPVIDAGAVGYSLALLDPDCTSPEARYAGSAILLNLSSSNSYKVHQEFLRCKVAETLAQLLTGNCNDKSRLLMAKTLVSLISRKKTLLPFAQATMPIALHTMQTLCHDFPMSHQRIVLPLKDYLKLPDLTVSPEWSQSALQLAWKMSTLSVLMDRDEWRNLDLALPEQDGMVRYSHHQIVKSLNDLVTTCLTLPPHVNHDYTPMRKVEVMDLDEAIGNDDVRAWRQVFVTLGSTLAAAMHRRGLLQPGLLDKLVPVMLQEPLGGSCMIGPILSLCYRLLSTEPRRDLYPSFFKLYRMHSEHVGLLNPCLCLCLGPRTSPNWLHFSSYTSGLVLSSDYCQVKNEAWSFESARANRCCTLGGKYGYEVEILTNDNVVQIGWASGDCEFDETGGLGVGDDDESYAIDGLRRQKWHGLSSSDSYGEAWHINNLLTCLLDLDQGKISYLLNGRDMGVAFDNLDVTKEWYPALSMSTGQESRIIFGDGPSGALTFLPQDYQPLGMVVNEKRFREALTFACEPLTESIGCIFGIENGEKVLAFVLLPQERNMYAVTWKEKVESYTMSDLQWEILARLTSLGHEELMEEDFVVEPLEYPKNPWFTIHVKDGLISFGEKSMEQEGEWTPFWRGLHVSLE